MDEWVKLTEYNWAFWVAGTFALFEFFKWFFTAAEWLVGKLGIETARMRERNEWNRRLVEVEDRIAQVTASITEIKLTSTNNVRMFLEHENEVVKGIGAVKVEIMEVLAKLHTKVDEQNAASNKTDLAILRDRIIGGMRYFSQNKDEHGNVHISFSDYENMEALFHEYFAKGGNGTIKNMYENEFKHFIIDR